MMLIITETARATTCKWGKFFSVCNISASQTVELFQAMSKTLAMYNLNESLAFIKPVKHQDLLNDRTSSLDNESLVRNKYTARLIAVSII